MGKYLHKKVHFNLDTTKPLFVLRWTDVQICQKGFKKVFRSSVGPYNLTFDFFVGVWVIKGNANGLFALRAWFKWEEVELPVS